jgi:hypothetical protein
MEVIMACVGRSNLVDLASLNKIGTHGPNFLSRITKFGPLPTVMFGLGVQGNR